MCVCETINHCKVDVFSYLLYIIYYSNFFLQTERIRSCRQRTKVYLVAIASTTDRRRRLSPNQPLIATRWSQLMCEIVWNVGSASINRRRWYQRLLEQFPVRRERKQNPRQCSHNLVLAQVWREWVKKN